MAHTRSKARIEREVSLFELASAYERGDISAYKEAVRPDVALTLTGSSQLAGTYHGYEAFGRYLRVLRRVMRSAGKLVTFDHDGNVTVFKQVMVVSSPKHDAEITLFVRVQYDEEGRIETFLVVPEDQGLFDHVIDTAVAHSA